VGTGIFILIREVISTQWHHHLLIVGFIAILIVMFAPRGFVGLWHTLVDRLFSRART
jgi:branched-chain amino acid transport system permease protein